MQTENALTKIASITVTCNPVIEKLAAQLQNLSFCDVVIIVDNASPHNTLIKIREYIANYNNAFLIEMASNEGIAKAQNQGALAALDYTEGLTHFLFLDHDSIPGKEFVSTMLNEFVNLNHGEQRVAALGPRLVDPRSNSEYGFHVFRFPIYRRVKLHSAESMHLEVPYLNSSGTVVSVAAWIEVGKFDEHLFIDFVDTDWCFRAISKNFKVLGSFNSVIAHEIGDYNLSFWFFGKRMVPYRKPLRHFYTYRNACLLMRKKYVPLWWKVLCVVKLCSTIILFAIFSEDRKKQVNSMLKGVRVAATENRGSVV